MKLLFIGNSHTYYNSMPELVMRLLEATGQKTHVTMLTAGGKGLAYHVSSPATAFNVRCGGYDAVIVQEKASGFSTEEFFVPAKMLKDMADKAKASFYLYMPWAKRDAHDTQKEMTDAHREFCRANGCFFAPVGEVFGRFLATESADLLYREDGCHATPLGSYIAAVTVFYTITGRKRVIKVSDIDDPGLALGFDEGLCQRVHTEACHTMRLFNG